MDLCISGMNFWWQVLQRCWVLMHTQTPWTTGKPIKPCSLAWCVFLDDFWELLLILGGLLESMGLLMWVFARLGLRFCVGKQFHWEMGVRAAETCLIGSRSPWTNDQYLCSAGNEASGLSPGTRSLCHKMLSIPPGIALHPGLDSLNVSVATGKPASVQKIFASHVSLKNQDLQDASFSANDSIFFSCRDPLAFHTEAKSKATQCNFTLNCAHLLKSSLFKKQKCSVVRGFVGGRYRWICRCSF